MARAADRSTIRMMVTIHAVGHLNAHAKEAAGLPFVDAKLHQPSCCGVTQRVPPLCLECYCAVFSSLVFPNSR